MKFIILILLVVFAFVGLPFYVTSRVNDIRTECWAQRVSEVKSQGFEIISSESPSYRTDKGWILSKKDDKLTLWLYRGDRCSLVGLQNNTGQIPQ